MFLVSAEDETGTPLPTQECKVCIWIPKASDVTGVHEPPLAEKASLRQNYPNPFNPSTTIEFSIPRSGAVRLTVSDFLGREVAVLADGEYQAGTHSCRFTGAQHPSGMYMYRLGWDGGTVTRKMVLLR